MATASEEAGQLELFSETADSPKGADAQADEGQPSPARSGVPKSGNEDETAVPAMTMEEVASEGNLRKAFEQVKGNKGAAGPDRQSVDEVAAGLGTLIPALSRSLPMNRRFIRRATASGLGAVVTRRSPRPSSIWRKVTSTW